MEGENNFLPSHLKLGKDKRDERWIAKDQFQTLNKNLWNNQENTNNLEYDKMKALYWNFNNTSSKKIFQKEKLFKVNKIKSNSKDSRRIFMQENAKAMLGVKENSASSQFNKLKEREDNEYFNRERNILQVKCNEGRLPSLNIRSRTNKKRRVNSESPGRMNRINCKIENKEDILNSLKINLIKNLNKSK